MEKTTSDVTGIVIISIFLLRRRHEARRKKKRKKKYLLCSVLRSTSTSSCRLGVSSDSVNLCRPWRDETTTKLRALYLLKVYTYTAVDLLFDSLLTRSRHSIFFQVIFSYSRRLQFDGKNI